MLNLHSFVVIADEKDFFSQFIVSLAVILKKTQQK